MRWHSRTTGYLAIGALLLTAGGMVAQAQTKYNFGQSATQAQIDAWNLDVFPDGRNLPSGQGSVLDGKQIYEARCASCHGNEGQGDYADRLAGGIGSLASSKAARTVGSYWPYATTLFDYIRRAMPLDAPQSLSDSEVYAVSGYVLYLNGLVPEDATVSAETLTSLKMPNRDGFVFDTRPDVKTSTCTQNCSE